MINFLEIKECFHLALRNLRNRSLRSWLTILGIVIGVFLIISLFSLSEGLKESLMTQLRMMRGDLIFIIPGEIKNMIMTVLGGLEFSNSEIQTIEKVMGVETVVVFPYAADVIRYKGEAEISLLAGIDWGKALSVVKEDMGYQVTEGNFPRPGTKEVLVGSLVPKEIFPGMKVGDEITIKSRKFKITGILMSVGSKQDDSMIILDLADFRSVTNKKEGSQFLIVKPEAGFKVKEVVENIKTVLSETRKRKLGEDAPGFSVMTAESWASIASNIMGIIQIVVLVFASIALLVGGIGIMNTMFTSVRERTREIGIMKAVGAKDSTILTIFLFESGIIGVIGGFGGTILGIVLAKFVEKYSQTKMFYLSASTKPSLIIFGLLFSLFVGCLAGLFPAKKAAQLKPVDALRHYE